MRVGMIAPSIAVPVSLPERTSRSAVGSPEAVFTLRSSTSAFIALQTRRMPSRVGLIPTFLIKISESGTMSPAAIKKAAEEISPGTRIFCP